MLKFNQVVVVWPRVLFQARLLHSIDQKLAPGSYCSFKKYCSVAIE